MVSRSYLWCCLTDAIRSQWLIIHLQPERNCSAFEVLSRSGTDQLAVGVSYLGVCL